MTEPGQAQGCPVPAVPCSVPHAAASAGGGRGAELLKSPARRTVPQLCFAQLVFLAK